MTDLEYMICEAESVGEIDLETRDNMLGILYESNYDGVDTIGLIDKYSKKNYHNKIIAMAIHKLRKDPSNQDIADNFIDEQLKQYEYLIDKCYKYKKTALKKIPMKDILKNAGGAGIRGAIAGAGTSLACNALGLRTDIAKSAVGSAVLSSAATTANDAHTNRVMRTKASFEDSIKRLTYNMNKLKSEYPKQRDAYKNSFNYKRRLKKFNKQQEVKEYVDDLYNLLL